MEGIMIGERKWSLNPTIKLWWNIPAIIPVDEEDGA